MYCLVYFTTSPQLDRPRKSLLVALWDRACMKLLKIQWKGRLSVVEAEGSAFGVASGGTFKRAAEAPILKGFWIPEAHVVPRSDGWYQFLDHGSLESYKLTPHVPQREQIAELEAGRNPSRCKQVSESFWLAFSHAFYSTQVQHYLCASAWLPLSLTQRLT